MRGRDPCVDIRMSKLSFRARALDSSKMMPVFRSEEIPDLPDFAAINRSVPQMPTGMEKEEECEHHLQRAISAQQAFGHTGELVIPTPEVYKAPDDFYNALYPNNFKLPRQLIHVAPFDFEQEVPDYDLDSEDEVWLEQQKDLPDLTPLKFEEMMDKLEKSSGQQVVLIDEAKLLLKERDDLITAVYDYWVDKRLRTQQSLIPLVKTERRDGTANNSPYVAFRRRTEKMQTRKNRKNDEVSYEKMLKLRRDLSRAVDLLQLVKHREKLKHDHLQLSLEIFKKRYEIGDYSGQVLAEVSALRLIKPTSTYLPFNNFNMLKQGEKIRSKIDETLQPPRRKREYRRRHKQGTAHVQKAESTESNEFIYTSDEEILNGNQSQPTSDQEEEDPDGPYAFKRQKGCSYHAPLIEQKGNWPWCSSVEGGLGDKRYRFCLTSINIGLNQRCIGFARRRYGRGGRIIFDRAWTPMDKYWSKLDSNHENEEDNEFIDEIKKEWIHFRPKSSPQSCVNEEVYQEPEAVIDEQGNLIPVVKIDLPNYFEESGCFSSSNKPNNETLDIESFKNHQKELFEMQRKQLERLKEKESTDTTNNTTNSDINLYMCNVSPEHSFPPSNMNSNQFSSAISFSSSETNTNSAKNISNTITNSINTANNTNHNKTNNTDNNSNNSISTIPQPSTLDSASVNFALRAVVDTVF
ncbi:enhancer of polycomb homolog 1 [Tetranychus urticae]|uniref:enhancer of polycomb homolog 1 n=1 Tax=Tetranychus urticae TaxID=32264 RepID=UPI00077BE15B|nr:enhancer of polycomb homolog 1 [Tetranychus urticae]